MDYEEKYKDLVKRLNKAREEKGVYTFNSVLDVVAPELKIDESEDERIRKEIIDFLELPHPQFVGKRHQEEWITWLEKQGKQKPAWSEEDEDILNTIINHFKVDIECTDDDDIIKWLKSLKERVQPQQEWSEEDKRILSGLSRLVKDCYLNGGYTLPTDEYDEYKKWLKSLRPQNTWKPSDEQMKIVKDAIGTYGAHSARGLLFEDLYQELKKLKE